MRPPENRVHRIGCNGGGEVWVAFRQSGQRWQLAASAAMSASIFRALKHPAARCGTSNAVKRGAAGVRPEPSFTPELPSQLGLRLLQNLLSSRGQALARTV